MIRHLRITNFAILSDVEMAFGPGFNVLTGETGAGKSLIVDAVALLRGGRARSDIPRAGADEAVVEAVFEPPEDLRARVAERLGQAGLPAGTGDGDEVLVRRVIARGGRSRIHVNGGMATAQTLALVSELLVDLAGQHEHQGLVDAARQMEILDAFGVDPAMLARMHELAAKLRSLGDELATSESAERTRAEREDFLRYQVDEIRAAKLTAGEETTLAEERDRLRAAGKLAGAAQHAEEALYSREGAAVDVLSSVVRELEPLVAIDKRLETPWKQLQEASGPVRGRGAGAQALWRIGDLRWWPAGRDRRAFARDLSAGAQARTDRGRDPGAGRGAVRRARRAGRWRGARVGAAGGARGGARRGGAGRRGVVGGAADGGSQAGEGGRGRSRRAGGYGAGAAAGRSSRRLASNPVRAAGIAPSSAGEPTPARTPSRSRRSPRAASCRGSCWP